VEARLFDVADVILIEMTYRVVDIEERGVSAASGASLDEDFSVKGRPMEMPVTGDEVGHRLVVTEWVEYVEPEKVNPRICQSAGDRNDRVVPTTPQTSGETKCPSEVVGVVGADAPAYS
jgi:hypothetical protein